MEEQIFQDPPIIRSSDELREQLYARCDELHLNEETRCRLWFMSYDDPPLVHALINCDDDEVEHLLRCLDFNIKTYATVEYLNSKEAGKYIPPYDDRVSTVVSYYERRTPEERQELIDMHDEFDTNCNIVMGDWYEKEDDTVIDYGNGNVFDAGRAIGSTVEWIRNAFDSTGANIAVVGISGGKDSSVVAALCARALGPENVIGVEMADGGQDDFRDQDDIISHLGIRHVDFDIGQVTAAMRDTAAEVLIAVPGWSNKADNDVPEGMWDIPEANRKSSDEAAMEDDFGILSNAYELPRQAAINMPARIRLAVLYMVAQSLRESARVVGTANLSEGHIGWDTRYGGCGGSGCDLLPLANYTATEVIMMGRALGLPEHLVTKAPADGLSGKTDEDNFGFTYAMLDHYIRTGECEDENTKAKIDSMHARNEFKMHMPPTCPSGLDVRAGEVKMKDADPEDYSKIGDADE